MKTIQEQVREWWFNGADFDTGIAMYMIHGKNKVLKHTMPGRPARYHEKLKYELTKEVGIDWKTLPVIKTRPSGVTASQPKTVDQTKLPEPKEESTDEYPYEVRRVINEYAECYRRRGELHFEMSGQEGNNPETCQYRSKLLQDIKRLSARMDVLYLAREAYNDHREIPDADQLWPKEKEVHSEPLPDNVEALKQMKKNIQVSMVKDRNLLDYQQITKGEQKNPMQAGPKRMEIEKRITVKLKRIAEIEFKLVEVQ
jgi:hypothetical protein